MRSETLHCILQCSLLLEELSLAFMAPCCPKQGENGNSVLSFERRVADLSLDLMKLYEELTIVNATGSQLQNTMSWPTPASISVPSSVSNGSAAASLQLPQPGLRRGRDDQQSDENPSKADGLCPSPRLADQDGDLAAHAEDGVDVSSSDEANNDATAVNIGPSESGTPTPAALESSRLTSTSNYAASHRMMVQELQERIGINRNSAAGCPVKEGSSPLVVNAAEAPKCSGEYIRVPLLDCMDLACCKANTSRSIVPERRTHSQGATTRLGKSPPPVPPKRLITPARPHRYPPPPPPEQSQFSVRGGQPSLNANLSVPLASSSSSSCKDLRHASLASYQVPMEPCIRDMTQAYEDPAVPDGKASMTVGTAKYLDMDFSVPLDLDLAFLVEDVETTSVNINPASRPAKLKAIAMDTDTGTTCMQQSCRASLPRHSRSGALAIRSGHLNAPPPHPLPFRWKGTMQSEARKPASPCSTILGSSRWQPSPPINSQCLEDKTYHTADLSQQAEAQFPIGKTASSSASNVRFEEPCSSRELHGYYGAGLDGTDRILQDQRRIDDIVRYWDYGWWDLAETRLQQFSATLLEDRERNCARRIQHLLAVCASLKGNWDESIRGFIACLRTPIVDLHDLDDGDCAAAYWLGDLYAMQNRKLDASVAYALAGMSSSAVSNKRFSKVIRAERDAVRSGEDLSADIEQNSVVSPSIRDPGVLSTEVIKLCIERSPGGDRFSFDQQRTRSSCLEPDKSSAVHLAAVKQISMTITAESFRADSPWPMPYDPLFAMANVQQGRLLANEGHIVILPNETSPLKLP